MNLSVRNRLISMRHRMGLPCSACTRWAIFKSVNGSEVATGTIVASIASGSARGRPPR
jgi:hypothetical protein